MGRTCGRRCAGAWRSLDVEEEGDDVAVLHPIAAALGAEDAPSARFDYGAAGNHVIERYDLGADESPFHIGMDAACGGGGVRAFGHGPRPNFSLPLTSHTWEV